MSLSWARSLKHTHTQHTGVHTRSLSDWRCNQMSEYLWTVSMSALISLSSSASLLEALTVSRLDSSRRPSFRTLRISSWNNTTKKKQPGENEDEELRNKDKRVTEREREKSRPRPSSVGIGVCASAAGTRWRWLRLEVRTQTVLIRSPAAAGRFPSLSQQKSRWPGDNHTRRETREHKQEMITHTHNTFSKQKTFDRICVELLRADERFRGRDSTPETRWTLFWSGDDGWQEEEELSDYIFFYLHSCLSAGLQRRAAEVNVTLQTGESEERRATTSSIRGDLHWCVMFSLRYLSKLVDFSGFEHCWEDFRYNTGYISLNTSRTRPVRRKQHQERHRKTLVSAAVSNFSVVSFILALDCFWSEHQWKVCSFNLVSPSDTHEKCLPCGGRSSRFGNIPLSQWSLTSGGFHRCSAEGRRPSAASPPTNTHTNYMIHLVGRRRRRRRRGEISSFLHVFILCELRFEPSLTGIFNRKSSWLKRKPRSVLEDGLGVELNKPVGRSTRTRCRLPGNDVWKKKNGVK